MTQYGRREFLSRVAQTTVAGGAVAWAPSAAAQPLPPTNLRTNEPIRLADLTWKGLCETPTDGFSYNEGQIALRYVGDERRVLMLKWNPNSVPGNVTEMRMPPLATSLAASQPMTVVRQWKDWSWVPTGRLTEQLSNGWQFGGLWWDDAQQVLWYTLWPYYAPGVIMPFLGAVKLHDDGSVTKYGPWHYVSPTYEGFRKVCWYFVPIPARFQSLLGGRKMALGANVLGASGGSPTNWGPGLTAIHLPDLGSTGPVEAGIPLMDYSPGAGGLAHPYYFCRREPDYTSLQGVGAAGGSLPGPVGNEGFWQASIDIAIPAGWIDSSTRRGLLMLGQRAVQNTWYGMSNFVNSPTGPLPINPPDTMAADQGSTAYHASGWESAAWVVRAEHLEEVARGQRKPSADGMRPQLLGQWHLRWPEIPRPSGRPYAHLEGMVIDTRTNELIWAHARSKTLGYSSIPTVHVVALPS
jgi:hypothetical protein